MNDTSPAAEFFRVIIDFFLHPVRSLGGGIYGVLSVIVSVLAVIIVILVVAIIFTYIRIWEHNRMVKKREEDRKAKAVIEKKVVNPLWKRVSELAASGNESSYRIAIIDADSILEGHLDSLGIAGAGVQDKLKTARAMGGFQTIDKAFEAHGIRNAIAHSGPDFRISEREARRVIGLYESVFQEQGII